MTMISLEIQEYFGWGGNVIFSLAQLAQVYHTYKVKGASELSYILLALMTTGDAMYMVFGILDNSMSMFVGNLLTLIISIFQILQKRYYYRNPLMIGYHTI